MSAVPAWMQVLQALVTPSIAIAVGLIGFWQWRTAHEKVVLDLFDRRFAVFETVRQAVQQVINAGHADDVTFRLLLEGITRADFLFGDDVRGYLNRLRIDFALLTASHHEKGMSASPEERALQVEERMKVFRRICRFYEGEADVFLPYMRMDHKRFRSLTRVLKEANDARLSYADDKQRQGK